MKKGITLALASVLVAVALPAYAATYLRTLPLMTFPKNATYDSTEVAVPIHAVGNAPSASQDTTAWLEVGGLDYAEASGVAQNLLDFQINHQSIATSDTISYAIQWTGDEATVAGTASKFAGGSITAIAIPAGCTASIVNGIASDSESNRWVRVIVWNNKVTNSNVTRKFSVQPIARLKR